MNELQVITVRWLYTPPVCQCLQGCAQNKHRPLTRLINKRKNLNMTQEQMAKRFHVGQSFYAQIESGGKLCPDHILTSLKIKGALEYRGIAA